MAVPSMHVLAAKQPVAGGFDPLSIAWHSAYWAEDPGWTNPGDGNAVTTWDDATANGRDVTQATGTKRPLYRASVAALNGQPALEFDGTDDFLQTVSAFTVTSGTLTKVIIYQYRSHPGGNRHAWSAMDSGSNRADMFRTSGAWAIYGSAAAGGGAIYITGVTPNNNAHLEVATFGASASILIDGSSITTGSGASALTTHCFGGYLGNENGAVTIAFAGMLVGTLTTGEKADLLAWAQDHYGTP